MDLITDYRRKIIANSPHLMSASGAVVSFSDGADLPLKSLLVDIEPVQSGTGDPSPSNIRPISGWSAVKVTRTGKNLLPMEIQSGSYGNGVTITVNPDLSITYNKPNGNNWTTNALGTFWLPAGTYTLIEDDDSAQNGCISLKKLPSNTEIINTRWAKKQVFTLTETTQIYADFSRASSATDLVIKFMLFKGDTATASDYEPYNGLEVAIDLGQTAYGGTLDPLTGVLTVDRAIVDLGTLDWRMSGSGNTAFHYANTSALGVATNISTTLNYICSNYSIVAVSSGGTATGMAFTSANQLRIRDATYASASDFKTAMDGVTLCYEVANPTEIQLTPQQIRSLYGNNTIFADTGDTSLEYWAHP